MDDKSNIVMFNYESNTNSDQPHRCQMLHFNNILQQLFIWCHTMKEEKKERKGSGLIYKYEISQIMGKYIIII